MPKHLVLSNGNLLIGYDRFAQVRDFYFPYVGLENHTGGRFWHRIGIFIEGKLVWLEDPSWQITTNYVPDSLTGLIIAKNDWLKIELKFTDVVYNERDIFIRQVEIKNLADTTREVKIFFNQQFEIYESFRRDTAYYDPHANVLIHYKGRRAFLINATCNKKGFDDYSTGLIYIEGHEGTYKDAEDGQLSKNAIEHGPVDSILGITVSLSINSSTTIYYWIAVSKQLQEVYKSNDYVLEKSPGHLINTTKDYWYAWTNRQDFEFADLPSTVIDLFKRSLLIIRTHVDNRGAILASCDSDMLQYGRDTYSYVWPRDGSFSALAIDAAGDHDVARRFFQFCADVITPEGFLMHKYRPDQALGSSWHPWVDAFGRPQLPIQEDETALVIHALWRHYLLTRDLEFIESIYNPFIKKAADFIVSYRDTTTGLPLPSYDLWEEKSGVSTFTSSTVYAALNAAASFSKILGKNENYDRYTQTAEAVKQGIWKHLYDPESGYFYRMIRHEPDKEIIDKTIDMSAVYGIFKYGLANANDDKLTRAVSYALYKLGLTTLVGGVARYEGDNYYRNSPDVPGNPWFICTLWLAQYYLTQVKKADDLASVKRLLLWVVKHALPSGILSEQLDPHSGNQISAAPLTWSHSEYVVTVLEYLAKMKQFKNS